MSSRSVLTPGRLVAALVVFQCLVLVAIPYAFSSAPPLDVVEGLVWAPHWLIGTYKHPPLPAWMIEISVLVFRDVILGPYLVAQLCMALTYWFIYRLGRLFLDPLRAAAGTILMAGSYYFTVPTLEFNHNVVQLPLWSGALLVFAYLRRQPNSWTLWLGLGALGGFALYGKYTFALLLIVLLALALYERGTRQAFATLKPYLAMLIALLLFSPHLVWLINHHFEPFTYALERSGGGSTSNPFRFLLAQVADHLPMAILLAAAGIRGIWRSERVDRSLEALSFVRLISFGPILLTLVLFVFSSSSAKDMWGMPMFTPLGLWLVMELGREWSLPQVKRATLAAMALILLVGAGFAVQSLHPYRGIPPRTNWPMRELANKVDQLWQARTEKPLRLIGGAPFVAGLAALGHPARLPVMIGLDGRHSPWVNATEIADTGIVFLFPSDAPVPALCGTDHDKSTITFSDPLIPDVTAIVCPPAP